jgi:anthraniloyl-CoA monooxygenase
MRILCVGGGPAGLYFSILMKRQNASHAITVVDRSFQSVAHGWGVVFWQDLLNALTEQDVRTAREIEDNSFRWQGQRVEIDGVSVSSTGSGFGIGRQRLLEILCARATGLGVRVMHNSQLYPSEPLPDVDLVVACDGANSRTRQLHAGAFQTESVVGRNKYVWLGTTKIFETFTFAVVRTSAGLVWFHAYAFSPDCSTCIVECAPETWNLLGFDHLGIDESTDVLEAIFEQHLEGHPLLMQTGTSGAMPWHSFRTVRNKRWYVDNVALMGDAAHTTHFAIGSGTRLAIGDAIQLASELRMHKQLELALNSYQRARQAALLMPQQDAFNSARWFESISRYADLDPEKFAFLLHRRRSVMLPHLPPSFYYRVARTVDQVGILHHVRVHVRSRRQRAHARRSRP